jgi:hypothetical protein
VKTTTFSISVTSDDAPVVPPHVRYPRSATPVAYTAPLQPRKKRRKR